MPTTANEAILGIRREGAHLAIEPCLPPEWKQGSVHYRFGEASYDIAIEADCDVPRRVARVLVDGLVMADAGLPLVDDGGTHAATVETESRPVASSTHVPPAKV